jgi:hypothetical protein
MCPTCGLVNATIYRPDQTTEQRVRANSLVTGYYPNQDHVKVPLVG